MALITSTKVKDTYLKNWKKWVPAIYEYCKGLKRKSVQEVCSSVTSELGKLETCHFNAQVILNLFRSGL